MNKNAFAAAYILQTVVVV